MDNQEGTPPIGRFSQSGFEHGMARDPDGAWCHTDDVAELEADLRTKQDLIDRLERELAAVSAAIGTLDYLDPPDGGSVSLGEQVRRMRAELVSLRPLGSVETGMSPGAIVLDVPDFESWVLTRSDLGLTTRDLAKHDGEYVSDEVRKLQRAWVAGIDSVVVTLPPVYNRVDEDYRREVRDALDDVGVRYR